MWNQKKSGLVQGALASLNPDHAATPTTTTSKANAVGLLRRQDWKSGVKGAIPEKLDYVDPTTPQRGFAEKIWSQRPIPHQQRTLQKPTSEIPLSEHHAPQGRLW